MNSTENGKKILGNRQKKHNITYKDNVNRTEKGMEKWKNCREKYYATYRDRISETTKNYISDLETFSSPSDSEEENAISSDGFNSDYEDSVSSLIENRLIDNLPDPRTFCVSNDMKSKDSKNFREAMNNGLPSIFPCSVCNEEASKHEMEKNRYLANHKRFKTYINERISSFQNEERVVQKIFYSSTDGRIQLCKRCASNMNVDKFFKYGKENCLDWGDIPEQLSDLNLLERKMIAIYNCHTTIIKLQGYNSSQYGSIGGIAYVINDITSIASTLPRPPSDTGVIYIRLKKKIVESESVPFSHRLYEIRPYKIRQALEWLKANNHLYKDITLQFNKLDEWVNINIPVTEFEDTCGIKLVDEIITSDIIDVTEQRHVLIEEQQSINVVKSLSRTLKNTVIDALPATGYVRTYEDSYFWEKAFPCLFPFGRSDIIRDLKINYVFLLF